MTKQPFGGGRAWQLVLGGLSWTVYSRWAVRTWDLCTRHGHELLDLPDVSYKTVMTLCVLRGEACSSIKYHILCFYSLSSEAHSKALSAMCAAWHLFSLSLSRWVLKHFTLMFFIGIFLHCMHIFGNILHVTAYVHGSMWYKFIFFFSVVCHHSLGKLSQQFELSSLVTCNTCAAQIVACTACTAPGNGILLTGYSFSRWNKRHYNGWLVETFS